jgi:hypothetical protein
MFAFLRRRRATELTGASFDEAHAQVCTPSCRAAAHHDRARTQALTYATFGR